MFYPWLLTSLARSPPWEIYGVLTTGLVKTITPISSLESTSYNDNRGRGGSAVVSVQPPVATRRRKGENIRGLPHAATLQDRALHPTRHHTVA